MYAIKMKSPCAFDIGVKEVSDLDLGPLAICTIFIFRHYTRLIRSTHSEYTSTLTVAGVAVTAVMVFLVVAVVATVCSHLAPTEVSFSLSLHY